jgi:hypothetical protein
MPTCPHCQNGTFALSTEPVASATFLLCIVRCAACDAPIGVLQSENPGAAIDQAENRIRQRMQDLEDRLTAKLDRILERLPPG